MSYNSITYQILIASPSDVTKERDIAVEVIQQWNATNSRERQVVLLPLKWETHSAPEYGTRPQEVINRQIVDNCDLLVGVFWTRLGSPTGGAASGTIEEINRVAEREIPIMLYFSKQLADVDALDMDQIKNLREFKKQTYPIGLIETYKDIIDFKDKLTRQLDIRIRELIAAHSDTKCETRRSFDLDLSISNVYKPKEKTKRLLVETKDLVFLGLDQIPDYEPIQAKDALSNLTILGSASSAANKNYYRDHFEYFRQHSFVRPFAFVIENTGLVGLRDVYVEYIIRPQKDEIFIAHEGQMLKVPEKTKNNWSIGERRQGMFGPVPFFRHVLEVSAIQPQRVIESRIIYIGALKSVECKIEAVIYADSLSAPIKQEMYIDLQVKREEVPAMPAYEVIRDAANKPSSPHNAAS